MVVTLGQQYNNGEKPTVMLYTYIINRHAGTAEIQRKQNNSTSSNMVLIVIIYCYRGYEDEVTTYIETRTERTMMMYRYLQHNPESSMATHMARVWINRVVSKVPNPARGQLNRENEYFPVRVRA